MKVINPNFFEIMLLFKIISDKLENIKEKINHYKQMKRANSRKRAHHYLKKNRKRFKETVMILIILFLLNNTIY